MQLTPMVWEALLLASVLSLDTFFVSFTYGNNKIKIPTSSAWIINLICSGTLGISLWAGTLARQIIPQQLTTGIAFGILFTLGLFKLLDSVSKSLVKRHKDFRSCVDFSLFDFRFVLNLYADPKSADIDNSKDISALEAASVALALSLDGTAIGFGAAVGDINAFAVLLASLCVNMVAIIGGLWIGKKTSEALPFNLSWISGAVLIGMALQKL